MKKKVESLEKKIHELEQALYNLEQFTGFFKTHYANYPYKRKSWDGYWMLYSESQGSYHPLISEHRYLVKEKIGTEIPNGFVVHHIDGNKSNNSINNLELMPRSEHSMKHNHKGRHGNQ